MTEAIASQKSSVIQLRWSDEERWQDIGVATREDVDRKLAVLREHDAWVTAHYNHSFHGIYRVKP